MSENTPTNSNEGNTPSDQSMPSADMIDLTDIDRLLQEEDPEFTAAMDEVGAVESADVDIEIESTLSEDVQDGFADEVESQKLLERFPRLHQFISKYSQKIRFYLFTKSMHFKQWLGNLAREGRIFLQTRPKEFFQYLKVLQMGILARLKSSWLVFKKKPATFKLVFASMIFIGFGFVGLVMVNLKGVWLPGLYKKPLSSLEEIASKKFEVDESEKYVSLEKSFPQPEYNLLMERIVVNLKPTPPMHQNPMGTFEFYVSLDSQETAVEIKNRSVELIDILQREVEDHTYQVLSGPRGKIKLKASITDVLNETLRQGWVKDVYIRTFILKP